MRQFVACQFRPGEGRPYTFHNDGDPVAVGDRVQVEARSGVGIVHVCDANVPEPDFPTKPILGRVEGFDDEQQ